MSDLSWAEITRRVHERAGFICEYCGTSQHATGQAMHVEHINPSGGNDMDNLCLSCPNCNLSKATTTTAEDTETGQIITLYNPRQQVWLDHFAWSESGLLINGLTPCGRATVKRLGMNRKRVVMARRIWILAKAHPPDEQKKPQS